MLKKFSIVKQLRIAATLGLITVGATFAHTQTANAANLTTFTDRAAFLEALGNSTIIEEDFNNQSLQTFNSAFNLELGDFSISSNDVASDTIGVRQNYLGNNIGIDGTRYFGITGNYGGPSFEVAFDTERYVFGFDYEDVDPTDSYAIEILGQTFEDPPFGVDFTGTGFFGVISDTAFSEVDFFQTAAGGIISGFGFDNFITSEENMVEEPQSTPEPATIFALLSVSALAAKGLKRKKEV